MDYDEDTFLKALLVCPVCKGALAFSSDAISCTTCGQRFPQPDGGYTDLLVGPRPGRPLKNDESNWEERQQEMEAWYQDLIADPAWAASCFANDYEPHAPFLATVSGRVLDLGGGNGVARHYLPRRVQYVVADPSFDWLKAEWASLAGDFPCLETSPPFVRSIGEHLPFPAQTFDVVLALWSLNHVSRPGQVFDEVHRVLEPGGRFLAVLEDMEPDWRDLLSRAFRVRSTGHAAAVVADKLRCALPRQQWPVQKDHLRIRESDLRGWSAQRFEITRRAWVSQYLTYEFQKPTLEGESARP